jgi:hypothetical protein
MKRLFFLLFTVLTITSCDQTSGSGNIITETRTTGSFDAISVGGSFDVEVNMGDVLSVKVEADDNIMKYIETRVSGNTLKIRTEKMHNYSNVHMKVYITVPSLTSISTSGSADVEAMNILSSNSKLSFKASSSSSIKATVNAPEIESDASSSASIVLRGKTQIHKSEASSSAEIKAYELLSENTTANVSSSANIQVHASVNLNAKASSSGSVEYRGAATVTKSENSSGSVEKNN